MSEQARRLIAENLKTKNPYLDLGNCGLTDLNEIPELFECVHLETLILIGSWHEWEKYKYEIRKSKNKGTRNSFRTIPSSIVRLSNLNNLICGAESDYDDEIDCFLELKNLEKLNYLQIRTRAIINTSFLQNLKNLKTLIIESYYLDLNHNSHIKLLESLSNLTIFTIAIIDISFIKYFKSLEILYISCGEIINEKDLLENNTIKFLGFRSKNTINTKYFKNLTSIIGIDLYPIKNGDLKVMKSFKNLKALYLSSNIIKNIDFVKDLKSLEFLDLQFNKIENINPLSGLLNLKYLDLRSNLISDIGPLSKLERLEYLNIDYNNINEYSHIKNLIHLGRVNIENTEKSDVAYLTNFKNLTELSISFIKNIDTSFIGGMQNLTNLSLSLIENIDISFIGRMQNLTNLSLNSIKNIDISFIGGMQNLTNLSLSSIENIDISFIGGMQNLTNLSLSSIKNIDISFIGGMQNLTNLSLNWMSLERLDSLYKLSNLEHLYLRSNKISDLSSLKNLKHLKSLNLADNNLSNIEELKELKELFFLDLDNNNIMDITPIGNLKYLQSLHLNNNNISDINPLRNLKYLSFLYLNNNNISDINPLKVLHYLYSISLDDNPIPYIPKEIYETDGDCINELRAYWNEIENTNKTSNNQLKIMFLGNGCSGKTTLLHWFIDNEFKDISLETRTHGIIIKPLPLCDKKILGNFWDFGGQEIYHATHRLFLGKRTLYILVWATETPENEQELRYPPQYWLDMIADIQDKHERSRVLIVQNLFENQTVQNLLNNDEIQDYNNRGLDISTISVNAKTGHKVKSFKTNVEEEVENLLNTYIEELPETWVNIRTKVAERRANKERLLSWTDFVQICQDCQLKGNPSVVIGYLHRAGEVYYYENRFNNQIILDQEWALKSVYAVLKYEKIKRFKGIFQFDDLWEIWQSENSNITKDEAKIFLDFMLSNQIMFYTKERENRNENVEFVIPQLLPETVPLSVKSFKGKSENLIHRIEYAFLHRDIIERFIVRTAQFSKEKDYWKNGVFIEYSNAFASIEVLEIEKDKKLIHIECSGVGKETLLQKIREEFDKIRPLHKATESRLIKNEWQTVIERIDVKDKEKSGFDVKEQNISDILVNQKLNKMKKVFISYSHHDEYWKDELIKNLAPLRNQGLIDDWNDRKIEAGIWDPQIEKAMEESDIFLLLITHNFLASSYITAKEITKAYEQFKLGKSKIFPVICDSCDWTLQPLTHNEKEMHPTLHKEMYVGLWKFQAFPKDGIPIRKWSNQQDGFMDLINNLKMYL